MPIARSYVESLLPLALLFAGLACSTQPTTSSAPSQDEQAVLAVVSASIDALNEEDEEAYLATIHPESKFRRTEYIDSLRQAFSTFNAHQELSNLKVSFTDQGEATVTFVMTVDFNSPDFENTRITGAYMLRFHQETWLIYDDQIDKVEPIR